MTNSTPSCLIASVQLWNEQEVASDTIGDPSWYILQYDMQQ